MFIFLLSIATAQNLTSISPGNETFQVEIAHYGYVPYNRTIRGNLNFVSNPCTNFNVTKEQRQRAIVVASLGQCGLEVGSYYTQLAGASLLIYISDEEAIEQYIYESSGKYQVRIPTVIVSKSNGTYLLNQDHARVDFYINQNETVRIIYGMSSLNQDSYLMLQQFNPFQELFNLSFVPAYIHQDKTKDDEFDESDCLGNYCIQSQYGTGTDAIYEDLRQICISQLYNTSLWFQYVLQFSNECLNQTKFNYESCSGLVMLQQNISITAVSACVNGSFVEKKDQTWANMLLDKQDKIAQLIEFEAPSLNINGQIFRGDFYVQNSTNLTIYNYGVLEAVCAAHVPSMRPEICKINPPWRREKNYTWVWILSGFGAVILGILTFLLYRRQMRKMKFIRQIDGQYTEMPDTRL